MDLKAHIRHVPDFPKPGITFYDITTLLRNPNGLQTVIDRMIEPYDIGSIDIVVGIESRGFILGAAVADRLDAGFVPIRKPGKLPSTTISESYSLEYGEGSLELHEGSIDSEQRVLIVDDVLATGGTAAAAMRLVGRLDGQLHGLAFLVELTSLEGRKQLNATAVHSVLQY
jgi:adenine phosphoribosyltransferase